MGNSNRDIFTDGAFVHQDDRRVGNKMTIAYKTTDGKYRVLDAVKLEVTGVSNVFVKDGRWTFQSICESCKYHDACGDERTECDGYET